MESAVAMTGLRWIVALPLLGAVLNGVLGAPIQKRLGKRAVSLLACTPVLASFAIAVGVFFQLASLPPEQRILVDRVYSWLHSGHLRADLAFSADPLSALMILIVTGVGGLIHLYSTAYMRDDRSYWRYFGFLNLFTFAMLVLVLADNLLLMFVGWEGVGLCSYALIGFWYQEKANTNAGNKAFIVNRVGDVGFILGIFLLFWSLDKSGKGTVVFHEIAANLPGLAGQALWGVPVVALVAVFFFIGATGKSAQIPLYVWLPDAMAGPTPVSALIHAATMVTAGVYMIGRLNFLYDLSPQALEIVLTVGALTAFFAATMGLVQNDIKKVLAYSTVSQLGYMFMGMGAGAYSAGLFHLVTHSFFKACLFLGAGSVILAMHHEQDMRRMGGLRKWMPWTHGTFLVATLAISGIPPFAGFFSKDEILWKVFATGHTFHWILGLVTAGLTAFYMFRQLYMTFYGEPRVEHHTREHLKESTPMIVFPLVVLAALSLVGGLAGIPEFLGGGNWIEHWLSPVFHSQQTETAHHAEGNLELILALVSVAVAVCGILLAYGIYVKKKISAEKLAAFAAGVPYRLVSNLYFVDQVYGFVFVKGTFLLSAVGAWIDRVIIDGVVDGVAKVTALISRLNGWIDNHFVDGLVNGLATLIFAAGQKVRMIQTGSINGYLYVVLIAVVAVMALRLAY